MQELRVITEATQPFSYSNKILLYIVEGQAEDHEIMHKGCILNSPSWRL